MANDFKNAIAQNVSNAAGGTTLYTTPATKTSIMLELDIANVVEDVTPQLGGNLDLNSKDITGTGQFAGTSIAGTVTGTTQSPGNNSTKLATTAYVDAQVATEDTIAEMNDTTMSGLANLDILVYNSGTSVWENKTTAAAGIPTKGFTVAMAVALG